MPSLLITPQTINRAYRQLLQCEHLGAVVKQHGKCAIDPTRRDPFETLVQSIISQQLSVKAADTIEARVRNLVGKKFRPAQLLSVPHQDLRACGLSNRKVEYIQGIALAVKSRQLNFKKLQTADDDTIMKTLVSLRGVGQWTAEMFMIFSLGRMDIFSVLDVGLQRGMRNLFGDAAHDPAAMNLLAERWQPYRSIASWYLWKMVD